MATPKLKLVINNQNHYAITNRIFTNKIHLADRKYIAPGVRIVTQSAANNLPSISSPKCDRIYK